MYIIYMCASVRFRERCIVPIDIPCVMHLYVHVWVRYITHVCKSAFSNNFILLTAQLCDQSREIRSGQFDECNSLRTHPDVFPWPQQFEPLNSKLELIQRAMNLVRQADRQAGRQAGDRLTL